MFTDLSSWASSLQNRWVVVVGASLLVRVILLRLQRPEFGGVGFWRPYVSVMLILAVLGGAGVVTVLFVSRVVRWLVGQRGLRWKPVGAAAIWLVICGALLGALNPPDPLHGQPIANEIGEGAAREVQKGPRSIILITLDAVRKDHLGLYGYNRDTTPFLDSIAADGDVYTRAVSTSPWTLPAHASMLTGLLPSEHGAVYTTKSLRQDVRTVTEILHGEGYETIGIVAGPYLDREFGIAKGFAVYDDRIPGGYSRDVDVISKLVPGIIAGQGKRRADQVVDLLRQQYAGRLKEPFFLFLNFYDAHNRYLAPFSHTWHLQEWSGARAWIGIDESRVFADVNEGEMSLDGATKRRIVAQYDMNIRYIDEHLATMWEWLRGEGLMENTSVIITSDHGESFGERTMLGHGLSLHREQIDVPLVVWPAGGVDDDRLHAPVDSREIFKLILGEAGIATEVDPREVIMEVVPNKESTVSAQKRFSFVKRAVIRGCLKALDSEDSAVHLYDLCRDSLEERNLAGGTAGKGQEIEDLFSAVAEKGILIELAAGQVNPASEQLREKLRSLGYLE